MTTHRKKDIMKTRIALISVSGFVAYKVFSRIQNANHRRRMEAIKTPPLSPQLQAWSDYIEKYPKLEDDPKIKHALEVLDSVENEK